MAAKQTVVCVEHGLPDDMDCMDRRPVRIPVGLSTPAIACLRPVSPAAYASLPDDREGLRELVCLRRAVTETGARNE